MRQSALWLAVTCILMFAPFAAAAPVPVRSDLQLRKLLGAGTTAPHLVRIQRDPRDNTLYLLKEDGSIHRLSVAPGAGSSLTQVFTGSDYASGNTISSAQGFAIGPNGTMYVVINTTSSDQNTTRATVFRGIPAGSSRSWSVLAASAAYPRSKTAFDHVFNGIVVAPEGDRLYLNSGSRTDHGEVQNGGGLFPDLREAGLTGAIFELPTNGQSLSLPNDRSALRSAGYIFAEGTRNSFDLAFAPNGDLLATENGPDRDMPDELNWLRRGGNFGFPWTIGGLDNPQQFAGYDPATDRLLNPAFTAVINRYYHNDPLFPAAPANLLAPIPNFGPDADSFRNASTGSIQDASSLSLSVSTFTAHRSPLGLVFVNDPSVGLAYRGHAFVLSFTPGNASGDTQPGPFDDLGQDLLDLNLDKTGGNYTAHATRVVGGFSNPIDSEVIGNRLYVIEYGADQGVYEVTLPLASQVAAPTFSPPAGTFTSAQAVTIASASAGASIFYTTNGSAPSCSGGSGGTVCGSAPENATVTLLCPSGQTISGIDFASYGTPGGSCGAFTTGSCQATSSSSVVSSACLGRSSCTVPANNATFGDPCSGTVKRLSIQARCGGAGAVGTPFTTPLNVASTQTLRAVACLNGLTDSPVSSAAYTISSANQVAAPTFSPAAGNFSSAQFVALASATSAAAIRFTSDGSAPTCQGRACGVGAEYTNVTVSCPAGQTIGAVSFASYGTPGGSCGAFTTGTCHAANSSSIVSAACVGRGSCTLAATNATFGDPCSGTVKSLAIQAQCSGGGSGTSYVTPIAVSSSSTLRAVACRSGLNDSSVSAATYTINETQVAAPIFAPAPGAFTAAQTVSLATPTSGATMRYTNDGSTPSCTAGGSAACGSGAEFGNVSVTCPTGTTIGAITFASYGTPGGSCGSFTTGSCQAASSSSVVSAACLGRSSCMVAASNALFGDPCSGTTKRLAIQAQCGGSGSGAGNTYSAPISVSSSQTLRAIACRAGLADSPVSAGSYTIAGSSAALLKSLYAEDASVDLDLPSELDDTSDGAAGCSVQRGRGRGGHGAAVFALALGALLLMLRRRRARLALAVRRARP